MKLLMTLALWAGLLSAQTSPPTERYQKEIFTQLDIAKDLAYGKAVNLATGKEEILLLDLYQPRGDTALHRPTVVWIHGGGFRGVKDKNSAFFVTLAERFARRGYVTTSIEYRLYGSITPDAVRQAYEDAKAAVRWLRANAKTYRLDTTRIAVGGKSAGGVTSLYATYAEPEGNSGSPGHSSAVSACLEMAGFMETVEMEAGEPPVLIIHGTKDQSVPYTSAVLVKSRAEQVGIKCELRPVINGGHDLSDHLDEIVLWSSDFLYKHVILGAPTEVVEEGDRPQSFELLQNYPNPLAASPHRAPATRIRYIVTSAGPVSLQVFDVLGREVATLAAGFHETGIYTREFVAGALPAGLYLYRLQTNGAVSVRKMVLAR